MNMNLTELSKIVHANNKAKGFWDTERNPGELLMLVVSELGEALEALRHKRHAEIRAFMGDLHNADIENLADVQYMSHFHLTEFERSFKGNIKDTYEDELADAVIRLLDMCGAAGIDIQFHVDAKLQYNKTRPHKHGKQF